MPLPEFSEEEKYLIEYVKSKSERSWDGHVIGILVGGVFLCFLGAWYNNVMLMICAFVVLCGFKLYEEQYQRKCLPIWRSIFAKYESAISGDRQNSA